MSSLGYCIKCGEAMESESAWFKESKSTGIFSSTNYYRIIYWCVNEDCLRWGLASILKSDSKPKKKVRNKVK